MPDYMRAANHQQSHRGKCLNFLTIEPHLQAGTQLAAWFEEETGAQVKVTAVPYAAITDIAIKDRDKSDGFDILQYWYPMLGTLTQKSILKDISTWWETLAEEIHPDDFIPVFRDTWCVKDQHRFGVPMDGDMHLLFYNKKIFRSHGLQPPETWDEYRACAKMITESERKHGIFGCGIMAADIPLILIGTFLNRLTGFGGSFFDEQNHPTLTSPEAIAALEHLLSELPYALPEPKCVAFDEMLAPWFEGRVAMVEFWADLGKMTDNNPGSALIGEWGVVPLPKGPGEKGRRAAPLNAGWCYGIAQRSRQPDLSLEFLRFCIRPDTTLRVGMINGGLDPARWSTYQIPDYRNHITEDLAKAALVALNGSAVAWPTHEAWPELQTVLHENLYQAVCGKKSAQQALSDCQEAWVEILRRAKYQL